MLPDPLPDLHRIFGFPDFRGVQRQVVDRVLAGQRTLAVMPTGAGKSADVPIAERDAGGDVYRRLSPDRADARPVARGGGGRPAGRDADERGREQGGDARALPRRSAGPSLHRAGAGVGGDFRDLLCAGRWRCSRSTRRIASANGVRFRRLSPAAPAAGPLPGRPLASR
ncbi:hypothetical protein AB5I41_20510 [Sphingomonas sp. MMS24-JH45]